MFQLLKRILCVVTCATITASAVTIDIPVNDIEFLTTGIRTADKPSKLQKSQANKNNKQPQKDYDPGDKMDTNWVQEPDKTPAFLNKPISLWGAVNNAEQPVNAWIAALIEPVRLWDAGCDARQPSGIRLAVRDDDHPPGGSDSAAAHYDNVSFHFGNGHAKGSLVSWWQEWNPRDASGRVWLPVADDQPASGFCSPREINLAGGPSVPDSGATIAFLGMGIIVLQVLRRKPAAI